MTTMDEPSLPPSPELLARRLRHLRNDRRDRHARRRAMPVRRQALSAQDRATVLAKTASRCHLCGGKVVERWTADHVLAHAGGGHHAVDNYLPAHGLCNGYRWAYSAEEFQWVMKIGVWAGGRWKGARFRRGEASRVLRLRSSTPSKETGSSPGRHHRQGIRPRRHPTRNAGLGAQARRLGSDRRRAQRAEVTIAECLLRRGPLLRSSLASLAPTVRTPRRRGCANYFVP
jgi:hypothetical protein